MHTELSLTVSATQGWVKVPNNLLLTNGTRGFKVEIDLASLSTGLHFAEIIATAADGPERGSVFRVPVTVVKPAATVEQDGAPTAEFVLLLELFAKFAKCDPTLTPHPTDSPRCRSRQARLRATLWQCRQARPGRR